MYAVVGAPSQSAAVLYLRREARITRKYSSFVVSIMLQFASWKGLIATKSIR